MGGKQQKEEKEMIEELKKKIYRWDQEGKLAGVSGPPTLEDVIIKVNEIIRYLNERDGNHFRESTKMVDEPVKDCLWAPTEEQMKALHRSIYLLPDHIDAVTLKSLYDQLVQFETGGKEMIREGCIGIKGPSCDPGRRGRMGGVPKEISKEAEAFQAKFPGPYGKDDIITAYEIAKMKAIEDLPKWQESKTTGVGECTIGAAFEATGRRYPILYCYGYGISIEQLFEKLPKKDK